MKKAGKPGAVKKSTMNLGSDTIMSTASLPPLPTRQSSAVIFKLHDFLAIQSIDGIRILNAIKEKNETELSDIIFEKIIPKPDFETLFLEFSSQDRESHKFMYREIMLNSIEYVYHLGFRPYQLCVWISIIKNIYDKCISSFAKKTFSAMELGDQSKKIFFEYYAQQEESYKGVPLFNKSESEILICYITGFIQHFQLFKYVCLNRQEQVIDSEKVWLELKTTPAESLKQAIPAEKWDDYCMKKQENARMKLEKESMMQLQQSELEIQQKKDELADKETARLKQLQNAEKLLLSPFPEYPVPQPPMPTVESIYRKLIENQSSIDHLNNESRLQNQTISDKKVATKKLVPKKLTGDLLPPPDHRFSKPLEIMKNDTIMEKNESIEVSDSVNLKYEYIPLNAKLDRGTTLAIITESVDQACEEWKKWMNGLIEFEQHHFNLRNQNLQKIKELREIDRQSRLVTKGDVEKPKKKK